MRRGFVFFAAAFIVAGFLCGVPGPVFGQAVSSVWKIGKDGGSMFLGGSIHVLRNGDFPLPEQFDRAFTGSSILVLETDLEQMADETVALYLLQRLFLPGGQTLDTVLSPETYALLTEKCDEYGLPEESIAMLKPAMVVSMLSLLEMQKYGFLEAGVDMHYLERAKAAGMALGFLESVESQIDIVTTMGDGYENDFVKYSLSDMDNTEKDIVDMVAAWRSGDVEYYRAAAVEMKVQWPVLYKTLLTDRNAAWLPLLREYLTTDAVEFVVVGLAHLHGPDGLLRQLEKSGCTVEQLR